MQLRIPGPTPCPPEVLEAMSRQMVNHRGPEFIAMMHDVTDKLKKVFQTQNDLYILTGAGTGGLEAVIVNMLSPGDEVLSVSIGVFGKRFADIAEAFGAKVKRLNFDWGKAIDADVLRQELQNSPNVKAVLVTQNETSTGVTNDMKAVSAVVKEFDKLLIVDAVSGLGSIDFPVDEWKCDVVVTGSQKGWMIPPGLTMVSVSEEGWNAHEQAKMPRFYWDFSKARSFLEKGQTPWTPAVSQMYGLQVGLDMMLAEGLSNVFARHARVAQKARDGVKALGFTLFADENYASNTVTAVNVPDNVDGPKMNKILREKFNVVLAGGQSTLAGKIFRIGHLGWVNDSDIEQVLEAIEKALPEARS